jgi:hypothetical protein
MDEMIVNPTNPRKTNFQFIIYSITIEKLSIHIECNQRPRPPLLRPPPLRPPPPPDERE